MRLLGFGYILFHFGFWGTFKFAVFTLFGALINALLNRRSDILTLTKDPTHRTVKEKRAIRRGLRRELILEFFLFTPASACLLFCLGPTVFHWCTKYTMHLNAEYILLGILSYGFPLMTVKEMLQKHLVHRLKIELYHYLRKSIEGDDSRADKADDEQSTKTLPKKTTRTR